MIFDNVRSYSAATLNRILQTSIQDQIECRGNVSTSMCEFIDENKFIQTENRYPFIQHTSKNTIFKIIDADISFENWVETFHDKITQTTNLLFRPTLLMEKIKCRGRLKRSPVTLPENNDYKKNKLEESFEMLSDLKSMHFVEKEERLNIISMIRNNIYSDYIDIKKETHTLQHHRDKINDLSREQKTCLFNILSFMYPKDSFDIIDNKDMLEIKQQKDINFEGEIKNPLYKIFVIEGYAGCGKSSVIESLNFYSFLNHKDSTKLLYITQTNILCQSMRKKCGYNDDMQYLTFFKFIGLLDLGYEAEKRFLMNCDALPIDAFQKTYGAKFIKSIKKVIQLPLMTEDRINDEEKKPRLFIIFDEMYTISSGKLSLFLFMVRNLKLHFQHLSICCILIGDKHQLRPFTTIEKKKLEVIKKPETNADPERSKDGDGEDAETKDEISKDIELNLQTLVSQNESLQNAKKFILTKQFRIIDEKYNDFVNMVRHSEEGFGNGLNIFQQCKQLWPEKVDCNLYVDYPIEEIISILETTDMYDYAAICKKFDTNGLFKRILDTIVFCFTNNHAHYYNIAYSVAIYNRLKNKFSLKHDFNHTNFISYSLIYRYNFINNINITDKAESLINNKNYLLNVLPLIRYCPYKLLVSQYSIARLSIVYLIDWLFDDEKKFLTHLIVYSQDINLCFSIKPCRFDMNLFKTIPLFGFPLQLAFSSTFASSQGLTLESKIAISCANISKAELYVCLTRIRSSDDLVRIF